MMTTDLRAKLQAFKALKVKHPRLEEVDRAVRRAIDEHASVSQLILYGASGAGKSTIAKHITESWMESEPNRAIVPVVLVEAHSSDIGPYVRLDYYRQVLVQLRNHAAVKDHLMNLALSPKLKRKPSDAAEWLDLRDAVIYALERLQVKAVIIDEAQHLMHVEPPLKPLDQLDWLKGMTNRTNVLHILVGNYELYDFRNLSGQAARRGRDLHFPRYHLEEHSECEEFAGALRYLLEHVPLICDVDALLLDWRWFAEWSIGCVGILRDWIVDTVAGLCEEGETTLTIQALKEYALQPDQRVRLEMEARAGEHKVEVGKAKSEQQLQELTAHPTKSPRASPENPASRRPQAETTQTSPSISDPPPKRPVASKIERAAGRDPVGTEGPGKTTTKCVFSGHEVPIRLQSMRDTGIRSVECPECFSLRSNMTLAGETVRFPSHDPRKTRTPNREARWVRREGTWEAVDK
jgi:tRNA A37 threonylcarbamoyladenosine biosynthesis protein TsaE